MTNVVYTVEIQNNGRREVIEFEGPDNLTEEQITHLADTALRDARPGQTFPASMIAPGQERRAEEPVNLSPSERMGADNSALGPQAAALGFLADEGAGLLQGSGEVLDNAAELAESAYNNTFGRLFGESSSAAEANAAGAGFEGLADTLGPGGAAGNLVGQVGTAAVLTRGMGGPVAQGAAQGALLSDADTTLGFAGDVATGGLGGYVGDRIVRGVGGLIAPNVDDATRLLHSEGVRMTPGQVIPAFRRTEERLTSRPFLGDRIIEGRQQAYRDFDRAAAQRALDPVGVQLPPDLQGHRAVRFVGDTLSDRYEQLVPTLQLVPDAQLAADITALRSTITNGDMSPAAVRRLEAVIRNQVQSRLTGGPLDGRTYRQIERSLGERIARFGRSQEPDNQAIAETLRQVRTAFQGALQRSNPQQADLLRGLNQGWSNLVRVERAAAGTPDGLVTPQTLRRAVRTEDNSVRSRSVARGEEPMQDLAEAGIETLTSRTPNSGTAERSQLSMFDPRYWVGFGQSLFYGPSVQRAIVNSAVAPRPAFAQPVANVLNALPASALGSATALGTRDAFFGL